MAGVPPIPSITVTSPSTANSTATSGFSTVNHGNFKGGLSPIYLIAIAAIGFVLWKIKK